MTRFVYPYNFVRIGDGSAVERKPAAGHDRLGEDRYTGVLHVRVEPRSPLFLPEDQPTSGTRGATGLDGHCTYAFLRDEAGQPRLPATTLKGVIRSLFETVTESCFSVFAEAERHVGLRFNPRRQDHKGIPQQFRPGRVVQGRGGLELQPCGPPVWLPKQRGVVEEGAIIRFDYLTSLPQGHRYYLDADRRVRRKLRGRPSPDDPFVGTSGRTHQGYLKPSWLLRAKEPTKRGTHHHELIFVPDTSKTRIPIPRQVAEAYSRLVREQSALVKGGEYELRSGKALGDLKEGSLVYYRTKGRHGLELARTAIPRISSGFNIGDLLPQGYHPCASGDSACPACRVFGLVGEPAHRGHVRFNDATWNPKDAHAPMWKGDLVQLRVLGRPRAESTNLYLVDPPRTNERVVDYDACAPNEPKPAGRLRGRKRYLVRAKVAKVVRSDYKMPANHPYAGQHQNITAELMEPDHGAFEFEVRFEQLEKWELGALLFAIDLPWKARKGLHLIGRGKPIGLGICALTVDRKRSYTQDRVEGWRTLAPSPKTPIGDEAYKSFLNAFRKWLENSPLAAAAEDGMFADLELLTTPFSPPVRYPHFTGRDSSEVGDKTFRWFSHKDPLPLPEHMDEARYSGDDGPEA